MGLRNVSLRTQVLLALLVTAAVSCVAVAWAAERGADAALDTAIRDGLTAARSRARRQVENLLAADRDDVRLLGETPTVAAAAAAFAAAFDAVEPAGEADAARVTDWYLETFIPTLPGPEETGGEAGDPLPENFLPADPRGVRLQASYLPVKDPADPPPAYAAAMEEFGDYLAAVKEELGFHDVFLVAPDGGRVLYTAAREADFATSLADGPYQGSNLAEVVRKAAASPTRGAVFFADFARYGPSGNRPAAFLATPVLDGPTVAGVLAVQINIDKIDRAMTGNRQWEREGLGRLGQVYLVGDDFLMRSNSRFLLEDLEDDRADYFDALERSGRPPAEIAAVRRSKTTILIRTVDNPAVRAALGGRDGTMTVTDFRGEDTLTSFAPLDLPGGVRYAVIAEKEAREAFAPIRSLRKDLAVLTAAVVCGVTLLSVLAAGWLTRPIRKLTAAAERVGAGDTGVRVKVKGRDEFAKLGRAFNAMVGGIAESRDALAAQASENERLLCSILPEPVAARMREGERNIADSFADVTVLFAELDGFGALTEAVDCVSSVDMLNELVSAFDEAAEALGVEKVKTIGEAYMAVCGLSVARLDHTRRTVEFAIEMRRVVERFNAAHDLRGGSELSVRVGLNAGPVTAGVVGTRKFLYDLWGDTVTIADDLRNAAPPDAVRVTRGVYEAVSDLFAFAPADPVAVPGAGEVETFMLLGEEFHGDDATDRGRALLEARR